MSGLRFAIIAMLVPTLLIGAAAGCGGGGAPAPQTDESVESVLSRSGAAMSAVTSLRFTIEHEGADVVISGGGRDVTFENATGRFAAPASAEAVIKVSAGPLHTDVGAIAIDGAVWITDPLTGRWSEAPDAFRFDPARIFRADVGLAALLTDGLTDARLTSPAPDKDGRFHVTARVDPARVATLTSGLVENVADAEFWIDAETYLLTETRFAVPVEDGSTRWTLRLSDYGAQVVINPPEIG